MLPLTVIICTYRREKAVGETLQLLFGPEVESTRSVDVRVLLIDQGRTLQREDFPPAWNLRVIHQDNFGGAGGFTRGMMEAMDEGARWLLLMDDDATPDPASFPILEKYIRHRAPDTRFALHGAMFSSEEPDTIYEAGAILRGPKSRSLDIIQRLHGHKPSAPIDKDSKLWRQMEIDYGAWWFFCIHLDSVKEVGLPLPLFVRGDDREYGLRLKAVGIPTIPLPGLRIWHPAHGGQLDRWYFFFDLRNKLIASSLHLRPSSLCLPLTIWKKVFYRLLAAEYDLAALMIAGVESFLGGPTLLRSHPQESAARARKLSSQHVRFAEVNLQASERRTRVTRFRGVRRIFQTVLLNGLLFPARGTGPLLLFRHSDFDWLRVFRLPIYGVLSSDGKVVRLHRRCRKTFISLLCRSFQLTWVMLIRYRSVRSQWVAGVAELCTSETWKKHICASYRAA
jgi:galactofuranosylgalactofuranosylrhamnosyl-N-acetylglucosaminyl-diphospho-decaprenol beta-1,5/1,6-galactofuranosyltransferase